MTVANPEANSCNWLSSRWRCDDWDRNWAGASKHLARRRRHDAFSKSKLNKFRVCDNGGETSVSVVVRRARAPGRPPFLSFIGTGNEGSMVSRTVQFVVQCLSACLCCCLIEGLLMRTIVRAGVGAASPVRQVLGVEIYLFTT